MELSWEVALVQYMKQISITVQLTDRSNVSLEKYFQEVSKVALVTPDEEVILARRIREGDQQALEKLTRANLRFVISVAKQYHRSGNGLTLGDLISEGNVGLIRAAKKFDETRGFKFISYAVWWIRQAIIQSLSENSRVVRLPMNRINDMSKIYHASTDLEQKLNREPTEDELAEVMDLSSEDIINNRAITKGQLSIDAPLSEDSDISLMDLVSNSQGVSPDGNLLVESHRIEIQAILSTLTDREKRIINSFFGLNGSHSKRVEEIAKELNLTGERVRQIKERAILKLSGLLKKSNKLTHTE